MNLKTRLLLNTAILRQPEDGTGQGASTSAAGAETQANAEAGAPAADTAPGNLLAEAGATGEQGQPEGEGEAGKDQGAPEAYSDFTIPEDMTVDPKNLEDFKTVAQDLNLTQEQAQKLVDFQAGRLKDMLQAPYRAWHELQRQWTDAVKNDAEIGGNKLADNLAAASRVFTPGDGNPFVRTAAEAKVLKEALIATGAGNNPEIVRLFTRIGIAMSEPGFVRGKAAGVGEKTTGEIFYPNMR